jgi:hypothetical protein
MKKKEIKEKNGAFRAHTECEETILKIVKDSEGKLAVHVNKVAWTASEEIEKLILKELNEHLGEEFSDEFDPMIHEAIETIGSCNRWD